MHIGFGANEEARLLLARNGYDPVYGARPLKRAIQHRIVDPMAVEILEGRVFDGEHLLVDTLGDGLTFTTMELMEA